jgi:hypothetical protein
MYGAVGASGPASSERHIRLSGASKTDYGDLGEAAHVEAVAFELTKLVSAADKAPVSP